MVDKQKAPIDQNKILGATYISEFFKEIRTLTGEYANYKNMLIEIEYITKTEDAKISDDQAVNLRQGVINIRLISNMVYIHYRTLCEILEVDDSVKTPIETSYGHIINPAKSMPDLKEVETFVIEVNKLLVKDVIRNLLETSQDILNSLYPT